MKSILFETYSNLLLLEISYAYKNGNHAIFKTNNWFFHILCPFIYNLVNIQESLFGSIKYTFMHAWKFLKQLVIRAAIEFNWTCISCSVECYDGVYSTFLYDYKMLKIKDYNIPLQSRQ